MKKHVPRWSPRVLLVVGAAIVLVGLGLSASFGLASSDA